MVGELTNARILKYLAGLANTQCRNFRPEHEGKLLKYISSYNDELPIVTKFTSDRIFYKSKDPCKIAAAMIDKKMTYPTWHEFERCIEVNINLYMLQPNNANNICEAYEMFYDAGYTFLEDDFGDIEPISKEKLPFERIKEWRQLKNELAEFHKTNAEQKARIAELEQKIVELELRPPECACCDQCELRTAGSAYIGARRRFDRSRGKSHTLRRHSL